MDQTYSDFPQLYLYQEFPLEKCVQFTTIDVILGFIIAIIYLQILVFTLDYCVKDALKR